MATLIFHRGLCVHVRITIHTSITPKGSDGWNSKPQHETNRLSYFFQAHKHSCSYQASTLIQLIHVFLIQDINSNPWLRIAKGNHGWDDQGLNMKPIFLAKGPDFKQVIHSLVTDGRVVRAGISRDMKCTVMIWRS